MKANKIIAAGLSVIVTGTMVLPVSAKEQTTTLNATVGSTYQLTIPAGTKAITYGDTSTDLGSLSVSGNVTALQYVEVTAAANALTGSNPGMEIPYTVEDTGGVFHSAVWSEEDLRDGKGIPLTVRIREESWKNAKAGNYTGTIVFKAELKQ